MHDWVIRGGTLVDGTGAPAREADVAIDGGKFTEVGKVSGRGKQEIDARGLLVTPGFVDIHTHYDGQVSWDPMVTPSSNHGCTTVVMGNCGVGFAPVRQEDREWLINVMEGVEDIPGTALSEGIDWSWESFPQYLNAIEAKPHVLDFAAQVAHSALRGYVMGPKRSEEEQPTEAELLQMKAVVREALEAGALGFTSSKALLHKTAEGVLVAGTFAHRREIEVICEAMSESGKGQFGIACEPTELDKEIDWLYQLAQRSGRRVSFNCSQSEMNPTAWDPVKPVLARAAQEQVPLFGQVSGRAIGIVLCWRGTAHPFVLHPSWMAMEGKPWEQKLAQLKDPAFRAKMLSETPVERGFFEAFVTQSLHRMYRLNTVTDYEPSAADSIQAQADRLGKPALELAYDALMENDGEGILYFPLNNYSSNDLEPIYQLHQHPNTVMGLSDGGAHCGAICDAGMPSFMLAFWTRARVRGGRIPLERIVHRQTQGTARFYGLLDRGVVAPGYKADLNVIDYDRLTLKLPRLVWDLPAGGRRLLQDAVGYRATLCSGQLVLEHDRHTGALPGKLIRGSQPAPG